MSYSEEYKERIECVFATFCKVVLRYAALNAYRDISREQKHEISLEYLMEEKYWGPSATDHYFKKQNRPTAYHVCGKTIIIENEQLGQAFSSLSEQLGFVHVNGFLTAGTTCTDAGQLVAENQNPAA